MSVASESMRGKYATLRLAELASRRLSTVLDRWAPPPVDGLFLYYPSRRQIRPALQAFVDFLRRRDRA